MILSFAGNVSRKNKLYSGKNNSFTIKVHRNNHINLPGILYGYKRRMAVSEDKVVKRVSRPTRKEVV